MALSPLPPMIPNARLPELMDQARLQRLDRQESYYRCTQDDGKKYDWNGYFRGLGEEAAIKPGWYVPLSERCPSTTVPVARTIVGRLTNMLFGSGNTPQITVDGDEETEAWVRACARDAKLWPRMIEARRKGGSVGSVVLSWGFSNGKPVIEVHNAKHCQVLAWADRNDLIPLACVKAYSYQTRVWDEDAKTYTDRSFWYVRYWDPTQDIVWDAVPAEIANLPYWRSRVEPSRFALVPGDACPVAWIQNTSDTERVDGECDYHEQGPNMDEINRLVSGASKGVLANADPTLVIKDERRNNPGVVKKGQGHAIFAPGGADYLEVKGDAARTAAETAAQVRAGVLAASQVIDADAEKISGAAQSAAALRLLYAPQTARCDELREVYGPGITRTLEGLLRQARTLPPESVKLRPVLEASASEDGEPGDVAKELRTPKLGSGETVTLTWPTYFAPTWTDKQAAAASVMSANGGKPVLSHKTSLKAVADLFGVEDVDAELAAIEADGERAMEREVESITRVTEASAKLPGDPDEEDEVEAKTKV